MKNTHTYWPGRVAGPPRMSRPATGTAGRATFRGRPPPSQASAGKKLLGHQSTPTNAPSFSRLALATVAGNFRGRPTLLHLRAGNSNRAKAPGAHPSPVWRPECFLGGNRSWTKYLGVGKLGGPGNNTGRRIGRFHLEMREFGEARDAMRVLLPVRPCKPPFGDAWK